MAKPFEDIKLTGMHDDVRPARGRGAAIMTVTLSLSAPPPTEWKQQFDQFWHHNWYTLKREVRINGGVVEIDCALNELEDTHLPELKKTIAQTNDAYRPFALQQHQAAEALRAEQASRAQQARDLKTRLKFD